MGYISHYLSNFFEKLGVFITRHPKKCIWIPIVLTVFLGYGATYYKYIEDVHYLYTITGSENKQAREIVSSYFPEKASFYDPSRAVNIGRFVRIIVEEKNGGTIFKTEIWKELLKLDEVISSVEVDNRNLTSLCVQWKTECLAINQFLEMETIMPEIVNGSLRISYPIMFNLKTYNAYPLPAFLGGINLTEEGHSVESAKGIALNYIVRVENEEDDLRGREWEAKVMTKLDEMDGEWEHIKVFRLSFFTFANEAWITLILAMPAFTVTGTLAGLFAIVTSMQSDCVRSKPALGYFGMISAVLATAASVGVLCFLGVPVMILNCCIPFLLLGIGMDDTFVLLAAWRRTNVRDSVEKRMSECYSDAAVSITITSLTDMLSFLVGLFTPIPCVQIFSAYAAVGVVFIYVYHLFFFGGFLALSGVAEEENKHSVMKCLKAIPKSKSKGAGFWKRNFLTGGFDENDPKNPMNESENSLMAFFRDSFSNMICSKCGQFFVIATFILYVLIAGWGLANLEEGIELERLVRFDSEMSKFLTEHNKYFSTYGFRVQIVIGTPLDYSTNETQARVNELMDEIYGMEFLTREYNENWLRDYTRYIDNYQDLFELNVTNEKEYNDVLREQYLHDGMRTHLDVKFSDDNSTIVATRFIVQSKQVGAPNSAKNLLVALRETLKRYPDLNATAFMPWFDFVDQAIVIRELTINLCVCCAAVVMLVTILFIPNVFTSFAVFFSICFIELGVLGFMTFLDVHLDLISVISIIACIGFAVDFSAHISYSYISSKAATSKERIREAMYLLGLPITQAAISTIIGVLGLLYIPAYSFHVNFKIILLVMIFATFHGLFVLPVLFVILKPENLKIFSQRKTYSVKKGKMLRF